jgi:hypothetical protein
MLAAPLVEMVVDGPHTARTPRLTMRVLRSCRPAAVERPSLVRPSGGVQYSHAPWRIVLRSSGVLLMPDGRRNGDETTLQRKFYPPVGVRIEALSALGRRPYSSSGATCDATRWQESRRLSFFPVVNDSVHAAIGSGKPKPSSSDLRSRWRADRADQASTMTLSSPQTWIGSRASERKTPPGSGVPSRQRGPVRLVAGDAKRGRE